MTSLAEKLLAIDGSLAEAALPHAFGGAIALAYCTLEPRGTRGLDVNVFVGTDRAGDVCDALPHPIDASQRQRAALERDGQVRVSWDDTPVDLFLDVHDFHREIAAEIRRVPFEGAAIPVLGCDALAVFKAMFNRTRDWADVEAMLGANAVDGPSVLTRLRALLGSADPVVTRFAALLA